MNALLMVLLAGVYLAVIGSAGLGDAAAGAVVGFVLARATRRRKGRRRWTRARLAAVVRFLAAAGREIAGGTWTMARVLAGRQTWRRAGFVEVDLDSATAEGLVLTALVITASPGTAVAEVDEHRGRLRVHAVDARDPDGVRAGFKRLYARHPHRFDPSPSPGAGGPSCTTSSS